MFVCPEEFLDYKKKPKYKFSIECLFKKEKSPGSENTLNKKAPKHGHFFTMVVWDKSIKTKYFDEALFIIKLSIVSFYEATQALEYNHKAILVGETIGNINSQLSSSTLSTSEREVLQASLKENLDQNEAHIKDFYDTINLSLIVRNHT